MSGPKKENLQLLERTFSILDCISSAEEPCTLKEIVDNTGISKPSVHRILSTLGNYLVVIKDSHTKYRIGSKIIQWGRACQGHSDLLSIATPYIDKIWQSTGETLHLVSYENGYAYYLLKKESKHPLQMRSRRGDNLLLHSTAAGKSILFSLPYDQFILFLESSNLEKRTVNTITDLEVLKKQRMKFHITGFSEEIEENEIDIRCIAAPVMNNQSYPIGAVSITSPTYLCDDERASLLGKILSKEILELSKEFGYKS